MLYHRFLGLLAKIGFISLHNTIILCLNMVKKQYKICAKIALWCKSMLDKGLMYYSGYKKYPLTRGRHFNHIPTRGVKALIHNNLTVGIRGKNKHKLTRKQQKIVDYIVDESMKGMK